MNEFTFFWRDGIRQVLKGADEVDALNKAGYGNGAIRALDFHAPGDNKDWEWVKDEHDWKRKDRKK